ncbi:hypothetical protein [Rhizobium binxianense]
MHEILSEKSEADRTAPGTPKPVSIGKTLLLNVTKFLAAIDHKRLSPSAGQNGNVAIIGK